MSKRNYNVFFNTHTVSGIVISVALYIIFFAGGFSFFREEIKIWEKGDVISHQSIENIEIDSLVKHLNKEYDLQGRDFTLNFNEDRNYVKISLDKSKDSLASEKAKVNHFFTINLNNYSTKTYEQNYSLGEFLFRLHFLDQFIYPLGRYLSGFIAIFFVFAIVTGVIVHWKKIIPNFYSFNPKAVLKRIWTDSHTALGIIGLPFQFMYGITGAFFILSILVLIPASFTYKGNQKKLLEDMRPRQKVHEWIERSDNSPLPLNNFTKKDSIPWKNFETLYIKVYNYGGVNTEYRINGQVSPKIRFSGMGRVTYNAFTGEIVSQKSPLESNYIENIQTVWARLHLANFGGITTKIIYFILAIITCFVIITGVLIWVESRNKKSMTLKQRLYTAKVGHIYLAICLSMLPVTALTFIYARITYGMFELPKRNLYAFYFIVWFTFILFYRFKRNNYFTNKNTLLLGAFFGFLIPIVNGVTSGNWLWISLKNNQHQIATIDIFWLLISSISLIFYIKIKPTEQLKSAFSKSPIDYKNVKQELALEKAQLKPQVKDKKQVTTENNDINFIPMRTKIITLWILIIFGSIFHYLYGVMGMVYFKETFPIETKTEGTPAAVHIFRLLMEGSAFVMILLTLTLKSKVFRLISLIWAIILSTFNCYHLVEEVMHDASNSSLLFILALTAAASILLSINLYKWKKTD